MRRFISFLRDRFWHILGVFLAVVSIVLAVMFYWWGRPIKDVQVVVLANTSLVEVKPEAPGDIRIFYKERHVEDLVLVQVKLQNTGNQPIRSGDYESPVRLSAGDGAEVIEESVNIVDSQPEDIGMSIEKIGINQVEFSPVLLNPGEAVVVKFLVVPGAARPEGGIPLTAVGRLAGVERVRIVTTPQPAAFPIAYDTLLVVALFVVTSSVMLIIDMFFRRRTFELRKQVDSLVEMVEEMVEGVDETESELE